MEGQEVKISKQGNKVILEPIETSWKQWFDAINQFSNDFMPNGREEPKNTRARLEFILSDTLFIRYKYLYLSD